MPVYLDDYRVEALFDGENWVDCKGDIVTKISCSGYGIKGNSYTDRVGDVGELRFGLNNTETNSAGLVGYYSPGHPNCRPGFTTGLQVRLILSVDGFEIEKFTGRVPSEGIQVGTGVYGRRITEVTVSDWMEQSSVQELTGVGFAQDVTAAQAVALLLPHAAIQPPGVPHYSDCESVFETMFDTTKAATTILSEFGKLANSELGYIYLNRKGLQVEGRFTRNARALGYYPKPSVECSMLCLEDSDGFLLEDGDSLLIEEVYDAIFEDSQRSMDLAWGKTVYNRVKFTAYPRRVDDLATTVLFNLENPIQITAGATVTLRGRYRDPNSQASTVSGIDMVTPVANTHYKMNTLKNGTGTDTTADLVVAATFGTGDFVYEMTNNSGTDGWITLLKAVGRGVYIYDPVEYLVEDAASIAVNGIRQLTVQMYYQNDPIIARTFAGITLAGYKDPSYTVSNVTYNANRSWQMLMAFLFLEPGDKISLAETVSGVLGDYFIHLVAFEISQGGLIDFSWLLKDAGSDSYTFWELGVHGFSELGDTTILSE